MLVDTLSQKFDLEVLQKDAGYMRSAWKYTFYKGGKVSERYRSRMTVKLLGTPWDRAQIKCESNWLKGDEWEVGYDEAILDDVYKDIQGKLSRGGIR